MIELIGQTLGSYRVDTLIGSGGMGQVYRGVDVHLNRPVAIKVMHAHLLSDRTVKTRFLREASAAAGFNHPNIIKVYDSGEHQGRAYLVMELAAGGSLRGLLQRHANAGQPLPWATGTSLVVQAAEALDYAHQKGVVHRDIKPDNLLLQLPEGARPSDEAYVVKLGDLGLAQVQGDANATATGVTVGTPAYISPEQCQGLDLDGRSDIYSLGIVLYEIATGYLPFETKSMVEALYKHVNTPPPPPRGVRAELPPELEETILRCLAKKPDDRYANAGALAAALHTILAKVAPAPASAPSAERAVAQAGPGADATILPTGAPQSASRPRVAIVDEHGQVQNTFDLPDGGLTVGRAKDVDVTLDDPKVSRRHLRIGWDGQQPTVTDLESGNGTWVGSAQLVPNVTQPWPPGADLRVGPYVIRLVAAAAPGTDRDQFNGAPIAPPPSPSEIPPGLPVGAAGLAGAAKSGPLPAGAGPSAATGGGPPQLLVSDPMGQFRPAFALMTRGVTVGRLPDNDLVLRDERVSRHHLRIDWNGHEATVTDLRSGNGTWLNGERLPAEVRHPWSPGSDLVVGPFSVRLAPGAAASSNQPAAAGAAAAGAAAAGAAAVESGLYSTSFDFPSFQRGAAGAEATVKSTRLLLEDDQGLLQQAVDLDGEEISVGRGQDNRVSVDDRNISRRHLVIKWDGQQATVTDLGSDNGTWLGDAKLPAEAPQPWPADEALRIGRFRLRLEQTVVPASSEAASSHSTAVGRVQLLVEQPTLIITPGQPAIVRGTVANLGNIVDHFWVELQGISTSWVTGDALSRQENEMLQLNPGAQAPMVLTVLAPRTPESRAGDYHVNLVARSRSNPEEMGLAQATWTVLPFTGSALSIDRVKATGRRRGTYRVTATNQGNAPAQFALSAADEERKLHYQFDRPTLSLEAGELSTRQLALRAPWYWLGAPQSRPFRVELTPDDGIPPPPVTAEFVQVSVIPAWVPRVAAGVIPLLLIVAILLQNFIIEQLRPSVEFSAPQSVIERQSLTLSWNVARANRIRVEGVEADASQATPTGTVVATASPTPLPPSGSLTLPQGLSKDQQFKLVAANFFGSTDQTRAVAVLTLTPTPTATATPTTPPTTTPEIPIPVVEEFRVTPQTINPGETVTITWQVRDAQSVLIEGFSTSALSPSGQASIPVDRTTTYVLTATNQGRPAAPVTQVVTVRPPTATPTTPPTPTPAPTRTP